MVEIRDTYYEELQQRSVREQGNSENSDPGG